MSLNDFVLGDTLGKGAFGSVILVTRKLDNQIYAMKRVKISKLTKKEKESALNEIRILASLSHQNIIGYKEAFFDSSTETLNIVMEFANDGDLEKKIKNNIRKKLKFEESTIWGWVIQLLQGMKYLHDNHIMHRDLKCANIFLLKNGNLKIGDLNVSKFSKIGLARTQTGTPYYCSPEIWTEKSYDYKSDIWSLGCIIYEICSSHPPFRGTNLKDLYSNVMKGIYPPIPSIYSKDLSNLIAKMLVIDPNKRASIDQLLQSGIIKKKNNYKNVINKNDKNVNLIKTIKLPLNIKEINSKLPKKRYREEEMMKNDEYETMKDTFIKEMKKQIKSSYEEKKLDNNKKGIKKDNYIKLNYDYIKGINKNNFYNENKKEIKNNNRLRIFQNKGKIKPKDNKKSKKNINRSIDICLNNFGQEDSSIINNKSNDRNSVNYEKPSDKNIMNNKKSRYRKLFTNDIELDEDEIIPKLRNEYKTKNKNDSKKNSPIKKIQQPKNLGKRVPSAFLPFRKEKNKVINQNRRPITGVDQKKNMHKFYTKNLYDKYKSKQNNKQDAKQNKQNNKEKIVQNNKKKNKEKSNNLYGFKYVPQKKKNVNIAYEKLNYVEYCNKHNIKNNWNAMKKYGNYVQEKNQGGNKNNFNEYLKIGKYKGGGDAGYVAKIIKQRNNKYQNINKYMYNKYVNNKNK